MKAFNVGILGATGAVGREMMNILEERNFPIGELRLLASPRSVGKKLSFKGQEIEVKLADENAFEGLDIVLGAASNAVAKQLAPAIVKAGAVFVDNSSAFRMIDDVPLVIPEINAEDVKKNKGIISNPNCSTIITLVAVNALNNLSKIKGMVASTYQATSGAGAEGPVELRNQMSAIVNGGEITNSVFQYQIAENVIPHIGSFLENGFTAEEMKMQNEGRKILHLPELNVTCTCVRVPVVRSHSISVTVLTERALSVDEVREALSSAKGVRLYDDGEKREYPMPLVTSGQDIVYVGRIRKDLVFDNAITLWCCGDQVRKGAATNAIQIAEEVIKNL